MKYKSFAAFIYVTDKEHQAVMRMFDWKSFYLKGDRQQYYRASFSRNGTEYAVIAAQQKEMGMTAAAVLSMKLIQRFRPQYLMMPGIAAGIQSSKESGWQTYGDVLLADMVWNCANGKYVNSAQTDINFGNIGFIPRPTTVSIDPYILPYLEKAANDPENQTRVHMGYLASGCAVMASKSAIEKYTRAFSSQTQGLEMESYGVAYAAQNAPEPRPIPIIAKSICDFGNERKDDRFQKFAAYTSCEFVKFLCVKYLPDRA